MRHISTILNLSTISHQPSVVTRLGDGSFSSVLTPEYVTSWAMPKGASEAVNYWYSTEPVAYFAYPPPMSALPVEGPSIAAGTHADGDKNVVVEYYPLNRAQLLGTQADGSFPLLPYGNKPSQQQQQSHTLSSIEAQAIARTRQVQVAKYGKPSSNIQSDGKPADGFAINEVGFQAQFAEGDWRSIQLAQGPGGTFLGMQVNDGSLPNGAVSSLLAGQQFLVISMDKNFGQYHMMLKMAGWEFDFVPPKTQVVGDYENVLIVKAGLGKVEDLVRDPRAWTEYDAFNDQVSDPSGNYLSRWLAAYCDDAVAAKTAGISAFETFVSTIQDPYWKGILALNVSIGLGDLEPALEPLLAGIQLSRFRAHHVGNEATMVHPPTAPNKAFDLDSAMFALVHYVDPAFAANADLPKFQSTGPGSYYDFKVLKLTASFLKSGISSFNCQLQLQANNLFGAKVINVPTSKRGPATNWVLINGSVQKHDGIPIYTFATAPGTEDVFFLESG